MVFEDGCLQQLSQSGDGCQWLGFFHSMQSDEIPDILYQASPAFSDVLVSIESLD